MNSTEKTSHANPPVAGKTLIVNGNVEAQSPDGQVRILQADSPVFTNDRVITDHNGMISIALNDSMSTRLDLGRMSDVVIDRTLLADNSPGYFQDSVAEVEAIQEAILEGDLDVTTDLEAPAAGPAAAVVNNAGGGHGAARFSLTADEVTPESGAETTGTSYSYVHSEPPAIPPTETPVVQTSTLIEPVSFAVPDAPAPAPAQPVEPEPVEPEPVKATASPAAPAPVDPDPVDPEPVDPDPVDPEPVDTQPVAGDWEITVDERHLENGTSPAFEQLTVTGGLTELGVDFGSNGPGTLVFGSQQLVIDGDGDFIVVTGANGELIINDSGDWAYTLTQNAEHPIAGQTGAEDTTTDVLNFVAEDFDGDSANGSLTVNIYDDGPMVAETSEPVSVTEDDLPAGSGSGTDTSADYNLSRQVTTGADEDVSFRFADITDQGSQLTSNGSDVTYSTSGNVLTGSANGSAVFTVTLGVDAAGDTIATFDLLDQLDHGIGADGIPGTADDFAAGADGVLQITDLGQYIEVVDSDGDFDNFDGNYVVEVENDVPTPLSGLKIDNEVIENKLDTVGEQNALSDMFIAGADETLSFSLSEDSSGLPTLFSDDTALSYDVTGNTLTASAGSDDIFTLEITEDGDYNFTLLGHLDHADGNDANYELLSTTADGTGTTVSGIDFSSMITATDADGDSAQGNPGTFIINVQDSTPSIGSPQDSIIAVESGNTLTGSLDVADAGTGDPVTVHLGLIEGAVVTDTTGADLTTRTGETYHWHQNGDGSWSAVQLDNANAPTSTLFTVSTDNNNGTYTVVMDDTSTMAAPVSLVGNNNMIKGGISMNALFDTSEDAAFIYATGTGYNGNAVDVNFSGQGIGVDNNLLDADPTGDSETLYLRFYEDEYYGDPANEPASLHLTSVTFGLDQLGSEEIAQYTLWNNGVQVSQVHEVTNTLPGANAGGNADIDFQFTITNDQLDVGAVFDEVRFEAKIADGSSLTMADYRVASAQLEVPEMSVEDVTVEIPFTVTDSDGDTAVDDFSVTLNSTGIVDAVTADSADGDVSESGMVISGGGGADIIAGTAFNDTINGGAGNDNISGGAGDDILVGYVGDDALFGNAGNDQLNGGDGNDQLVGGGGADSLDGGAGDDILIGDDIYFDVDTGEADILDDGPDADLDGLGDGVVDSISGGDDVDTLYDAGANDNVTDGSVEIIYTSQTGFDEDVDNLIAPVDPGVF